MRSDTGEAPKTPFYQFARRLLAILCAVFCPCEVVNPEGFRIKAPFILIANHQSMLDPVLLAIKLKGYEIRFIGKRELNRNRILKWIFDHLHMIAVSRHMSDLSAMRGAGETLRQGHVLGIFPEGTRRQGKPMQVVESGVSFLALRSRVPLLPVFFTRKPGIFRKGKMVVGPPIYYEDLLTEGLDKKASDALNGRIQKVFIEMSDKNNQSTIGA